ncbi:MAG TPA: hypothetical protein VNB54_10845, partial [Alphaproteobacteria bacterium]|nr:hypothetical protein [Alphaproteobacteria bacterium]
MARTEEKLLGLGFMGNQDSKVSLKLRRTAKKEGSTAVGKGRCFVHLLLHFFILLPNPERKQSG